MVMKCPAVCLVALSLLCSFCDGQWRGFYRPSPRAYPIPRATVTNPNTQGSQDGQQTTQIGSPLMWHYPAPPQGENIPVGPYQPKPSVAPTSVAVECREKDAYVEVKEDFFGNGQLINPLDLTLGTCAATAEDTAAHVLIFDVQLQDCGSTLSMTNDTIIYSFILNHNPQPVGDVPVVRTSSTAVIVQCHYPRMQNVSSLPITPMWSPFSAVRVAHEYLYFNMTLMTDDWKYLRPSNRYALGDMINIQVSVMQYFHVPLRIFVESCIATTSTDLTSSLSYIFIENGCMLDGILTGSASKFMNRTVDNKLQFQLDAFMFQGETSGSLFITCHLIATTTSYPIDDSHRACSYINGWKEASGVNTACASCFSGGTTSPGTGTVYNSSGAGVGSTSYPSAGSSGSVTGDAGLRAAGVGTGGLLSNTYPVSGSSGANSADAGYPGASYPYASTAGSSGASTAGSSDASAAGSSGATVGAPGYSGASYPYATVGGAGSSGTGFHPWIIHHYHPIHSGRKARDVSPSEIFEWEAEICLGPLQIREKIHV